MAKRTRREKKDNRAGKLCIGMIVLVFVAVMSIQIVRVYQKDQEYIKQQAQLEQQLADEEERQAQLADYEKYVQSQEYVEDVARSKLGMAYGDEIIFKEKSSD
jgi:cell division protein DivIC